MLSYLRHYVSKSNVFICAVFRSSITLLYILWTWNVILTQVSQCEHVLKMKLPLWAPPVCPLRHSRCLAPVLRLDNSLQRSAQFPSLIYMLGSDGAEPARLHSWAAPPGTHFSLFCCSFLCCVLFSWLEILPLMCSTWFCTFLVMVIFLGALCWVRFDKCSYGHSWWVPLWKQTVILPWRTCLFPSFQFRSSAVKPCLCCLQLYGDSAL